MNSAYLDLMARQDWGRIYHEMVSFALGQATSGKVWLGGSRRYSESEEPMLAGGQTPRDVASQVMHQTIEGRGEWRWDPARNPDIRVHLRWRIKSKLWALANNLDNRKRVPVPKDETGRERPDWLESFAPSSPVLEGLSSSWHASRGAGWIEELEASLKDDPPLSRVLDFIFNGTPPRGMAEAMRLPVREINNLLKRLKRRVRAVLHPEILASGNSHA